MTTAVILKNVARGVRGVVKIIKKFRDVIYRRSPRRFALNDVSTSVMFFVQDIMISVKYST